MNNTKCKIRFIPIIVALLSGCTTSINVNYTCNPAGALLTEVETGKYFGTCPRDVSYEYPRYDSTVNARGYINVNTMKATWPSGATATTKLSLYLRDGHSQTYNFLRPNNVAGENIDIKNAIDFERQEGVARATQQGNQQLQNLMLLNAYKQMTGPRQQPAAYSGPTNCTTTYMGQMANTNCY